MIGEIFRRGAWLVASLIFITLISFGVLSSAIPAEGPQTDLPIFLNPTPGRVERLARQLVSELVSAQGKAMGEKVALAAARLAKLGGAALPSVLPLLDSLSPEGRAQVAIALAPVRKRMGFEASAQPDVNRAILFWGRFWEEHAIDYRPIVAERAVSRLALRTTPLRQAEVRRLDTYALDALQAAVAEKGAADDVARLARLTHQAALIAGRPELALASNATRSLAIERIAQWEEWWGQNRSRYKTYRGTERITAMLRDTRYGEWVTQLSRGKLGKLRNGQLVSEAMKQGLGVTFPLALLGLLGVLFARVLPWTVAGATIGSCRTIGKRLVFLVAGVPSLVVLIGLLRAEWIPRSSFWVGGIFVLLAAGIGAFPFVRSGSDSGHARALRLLLLSQGYETGATDHVVRRASSPRANLHWGSDASHVVTLVFLVESILGLSGLGTRTLHAFEHRELAWLMAVTVVLACCIGVIQLIRDAVYSEILLRFRSEHALSDWSE